MKTTKTIISTLFIASIFFACKKKETTTEPTPVISTTGSTTGSPVSTDITFNQSIGSSGSGFSNFNFNMSGQDLAWTLATDGNFVYVGDFGNNCVKKIDLTTNSIVGWFGFQGNTWGYYTTYTTQPNSLFKPFRLIYKNNYIYAFSHKGTTGKSIVYKFTTTNSSTVDTNRVIPEYSFFTSAIDNSDNVVIVKSDSVKVYTSSSVTRFGGFGSADGKLDNSGYIIQVQSVNDTIILIDAGNNRIQKFSNTGNFISKLAITSIKNYTDLFILNNKYYFLQSGKFSEYTAGGTKLNDYSFVGNPSGFSPMQKQFVVVNNKIVFQDYSSSKLNIYTK